MVNPDDIVRDYGADTLRIYEMFIGDFEKAAPWNFSSVRGSKRFLDRFWNLQDVVTDGGEIRPELETAFHKTIKKVTEDIETLKFNTAIAAMMSLINDITNTGSITRGELKIFCLLLCPFAPHVAEEVWENMNFSTDTFCCEQQWPAYDESKCKEDTIEIAVQVNGRVRGKITVDAGIQSADAIAAAKADEKISPFLANGKVIKEIYVPGKLVNLVVK